MDALAVAMAAIAGGASISATTSGTYNTRIGTQADLAAMAAAEVKRERKRVKRLTAAQRQAKP